MGEKHKQAVERQFARAVEHCGGYLARDGPEVIAEKVEFVGPRSGEVPLDVACGSGTFALALALRLGRVYGVDLTREMLGEAGKTLKELDTKAAGKVAFYCAEAETLPFANGCHAGELTLRTRITKSSKKSYWTVYRTAGRFLRHVRRATISSFTMRKLSFFFAPWFPQWPSWSSI